MAISVWFNAGSLTNVVQSGDGTITSFVQPSTPTDFQSQINASVLQNNDIGLNVKWDVTDKLAFNFDYDNSEAWLNPGGRLSSMDSDVGYGPSTPGGTNATNVGIVVPGGHALPYPTGLGPNGNAAAFINNGLIGSHVLPMSAAAALRPGAAVQGGNDMDRERQFQGHRRLSVCRRSRQCPKP